MQLSLHLLQTLLGDSRLLCQFSKLPSSRVAPIVVGALTLSTMDNNCSLKESQSELEFLSRTFVLSNSFCKRLISASTRACSAARWSTKRLLATIGFTGARAALERFTGVNVELFIAGTDLLAVSMTLALALVIGPFLSKTSVHITLYVAFHCLRMKLSTFITNYY